MDIVEKYCKYVIEPIDRAFNETRSMYYSRNFLKYPNKKLYKTYMDKYYKLLMEKYKRLEELMDNL